MSVHPFWFHCNLIEILISLSSCSVVSNVKERGWTRQQTNSEKQKKKQTEETKQQIQLCTAVVTQNIYTPCLPIPYYIAPIEYYMYVCIYVT